MSSCITSHLKNKIDLLLYDNNVHIKQMYFHDFLERAFCLMVLGFTIYYTHIKSIEINKKINEKKENAFMTQEDYRIPLFVGEDGIVLSLREKPMIVIAEEYQDRCHIESYKKEATIEVKNTIWEWIKYIE
jgi:hypothetical protein